MAAALNADEKIFANVVALAKSTTIPIYSSCQTKVTALKSEETRIPAEYSDFSSVFSSNSTAELPEYTKINDYSINLLDNKQPLYCPIYSLGLVELETLKTYIEANLASSFIRPSKSPASTPILFVRKKDNSFRLYINYRGLNNLMIKNRYPLPLIGESLDHLVCAKRFT